MGFLPSWEPSALWMTVTVGNTSRDVSAWSHLLGKVQLGQEGVPDIPWGPLECGYRAGAWGWGAAQDDSLP